MADEPPDDDEMDADGGNLNTVDEGVTGLRRDGPSVGVVTLSDGLRGGV